MRRAAFAATLLLLVGGAVCPQDDARQEASAEAPLPPLDSVRLLRQARIFEMAGQTDAALERLVEARERFPDELTPLIALVDHHRRHGADAAAVDSLHKTLATRFADPEQPLPRATLDYLAYSPYAGSAEQALILGIVHSRLEAEPEDLDLLAAAAHLEQRLGRGGAAHATILRMIALEPAVRLAPDDAEAHYVLACAFDQGQLERARAELQQARSIAREQGQVAHRAALALSQIVVTLLLDGNLAQDTGGETHTVVSTRVLAVQPPRREPAR